MAFVFKAEKPAFLSTKENFPGPGQYEVKDPEVEPNFVSFLTKEERKFGNSTTDVVKNPGPGSYNLPVSVQSYNKQTKAFQSTLNPQMEALEEKQQSTVFKSISKRKPFEQETETPGPGSYFRQTGQKAVMECNTANFQKPVVREKQLEGGSVPSIPSFIHAYGYTEGGSKALRLNKNPLLEVQKFVGPGYYDPEQYGETAKPKGIAWEKTNPHKSDGFGLQIGTGNNVGPGSYKAKFKGYFPLYKLKPSAGFASKSGRSVFNAERKSKPKKPRNLMEEQTQDIEDLSEGAPGPGYYHNSSTASSFHQSQRPSTLQFFGSGNERFGDTFTTSGNMGPGKYNVTTDIAKKIQKNQNMQIPFVTAVKRFVEKPEEGPAPGDYEIRTKIGGDSITHVVAKSQIESFGAVEPRFKAGNGDSVPGPGAYHKKDKEAMLKESVEMATAKTSHMFSSTSKREVIKAAGINVPPPGSYDVNNFNLATKVSKPDYEDPDLSPKKPPFGIAADRFRNTAVRIDEEDNDDGSFEEDWNTEGHNRGDLILKLRNQPKQNAAFVSQTKRVGVPVNKEKNHIPGPGKYHGTNHEDWIKKTFNVNFTTD